MYKRQPLRAVTFCSFLALWSNPAVYLATNQHFRNFTLRRLSTRKSSLSVTTSSVRFGDRSHAFDRSVSQPTVSTVTRIPPRRRVSQPVGMVARRLANTSGIVARQPSYHGNVAKQQDSLFRRVGTVIVNKLVVEDTENDEDIGKGGQRDKGGQSECCKDNDCRNVMSENDGNNAKSVPQQNTELGGVEVVDEGAGLPNQVIP